MVCILYTEGTAIPNEVKELHVFSAACGGQNKNHTVTRIILAMTINNRFSIIHPYFPLRGHSFLPRDRRFSMIMGAIQKFDRIFAPNQYENLIKTAKKLSPTYEAKSAKNEDILNFSKWWPHYLKKTATDIEKKGEKFSKSQFRQLVYNWCTISVIKVS